MALRLGIYQITSQGLMVPLNIITPIVLVLVLAFSGFSTDSPLADYGHAIYTSSQHRITKRDSSPSAKGFTPLTFISLFTCFTYNHDNYLVLGSNSRIYNKERSHSIQTMHYYFSIYIIQKIDYSNPTS